MIRSSAWKTDHQLGLKIAVDLFLQEERTRLRRWQFLGRFDFYVGITIIVETNNKLNFSVDERGSGCDMDSGMYRDFLATEFVDMFPQTNGDIWAHVILVWIGSR